MYSLFSFKDLHRQPSLRLKLNYIRRKFSEYFVKKTSHIKYDRFIKNYILPYAKDDNIHYDCIVYGSDQIWRKQPWLETFNPVYFACNNFKKRKNIAYSASMGVMNLSNQDKETLYSLLSNFDELAVRESDLKLVVNELGYPCIQTVDPALLLCRTQWDVIFPTVKYTHNNSYVLFVNYIQDSFDESILRQYARERGLSFVKVNGSVIGKDTSDAITDAGPDELVNFIRNADVVFTSSFHAMIFSIIYEKEFFAGFTNNIGRAASVLKDLGIENRLIKGYSVIDLLTVQSLDYTSINLKLKYLIEPSIDYLKRSVIIS